MCGIAGFLDKMPLAEARDRLASMLASIQYRGPDDLKGIVGPGYGMGSVRLAIVDLVGGKQPAVSEDGKVIVVFNGEIFNFKKLRSQLIAQGVRFHSESEIETLLQLYLTRGIEMVGSLTGQFAIAIFDLRSNALHLIRDPFGIRPLFWKKAPGGIAYGSEIKTLIEFDRRGLEIDRKGLLQTLRFWTVVGDRTIFEGVYQVPPGHLVSFENGNINCVRYWTFPFSRTVPALALTSDEDYFDAFRSELKNAVNRQRMADVKVGCYVSGGIDSSVVAQCLAEGGGNSELETFSIAFRDTEYDESESQQKVVSHLGLRNQTVLLENSAIGEIFPKVVRHAETPLFRTAPAPLFLLSEKVRAAGIKVVMTGEGADEILLGYDLFRETLIRRFWGRQPASKCRGQLFRSLYQYLPQYRNPRYFNLLLDFYRNSLRLDGDRHYAMAVRWGNGKALESNLSEDMRSFAAGYDPIAELDQWMPSDYDGTDDVERAQYIETSTLLSNYLLSSQGDRMSMANSVEGRYPYLDLEFVQFCVSLPRRLKLRGLKDKYILRKAFADKLPVAVTQRPKIAYQAPELKAFFVAGKPADYVAELLSAESVRNQGLFDPQSTERLLSLGKAENVGRLGFRDNMAFVVALSTSILHREFGKWQPLPVDAATKNSITIRDQ